MHPHIHIETYMYVKKRSEYNESDLLYDCELKQHDVYQGCVCHQNLIILPAKNHLKLYNI